MVDIMSRASAKWEVIGMPRVALSLEQKVDGKLRDIKKWIRGKMAENGVTQKEVGELLGMSQGMVSLMLLPADKKKRPRVKKDPISYGHLLKLCEFFEVDGAEKERLLTL